MVKASSCRVSLARGTIEVQCIRATRTVALLTNSAISLKLEDGRRSNLCFSHHSSSKHCSRSVMTFYDELSQKGSLAFGSTVINEWILDFIRSEYKS